MRAVQGRHRQPRDFGQAQIVRRRLLRPVEQLLAVDDLQDAALVGAVAEIDAVARGPVEIGPCSSVGTAPVEPGSWPGRPKSRIFSGMRGIGEVVDLRHAARAPVRRARDQEGDAGVAFPPVLVRVLQPADPRDQHGIGGIGDVPDLMRLAAEGAQHVDRVGDRPSAAPCRRRPAPSARRRLHICLPGPGMCRRYFGCAGSVTSTIEVPFGSALPVMRIDRRGNVVGAAVMADIGDPAVALMMDGRLIGAARLQVAGADQLHVGGFGRRADHLLLRISDAAGNCEAKSRNAAASSTRPLHASTPSFEANLRWLSGYDSTAECRAKTRALTCNHLVAYYPCHG